MRPLILNLLEYFQDNVLDDPQKEPHLFAIIYKLPRNKCEYNFFSHSVIIVMTLINYVLSRQR